MSVSVCCSSPAEFSKIFEPDLCPLPFDQRKVFDFIFTRLAAGGYNDVLDALDWLHLLCRMDIRISMDMLIDMATVCLKRTHEIRPRKEEEDDLDEDVGPLALQVVMVDIIAQQVGSCLDIHHMYMCYCSSQGF